MYKQYFFSEQKQEEAEVEVKRTDPTWSHSWLFLYWWQGRKIPVTVSRLAESRTVGSTSIS